MSLSPAQLVACLDSANLRLHATAGDITALCQEAIAHRFASVLVYPGSVALAAHLLAGTTVKIGTVVGFPSGRHSTEAKSSEIDAAHGAGAHEVDLVMNYAALRDGDAELVDAELRALVRRAHGYGMLAKVIVETCYLSADQRIAALRFCEDAGADFIATSTGFGADGAKVEHIAAWAAARRGGIGIKASGGINTLAEAHALLEAGATRLGTDQAAAILVELGGAQSDAPSPGD